MKKLAIVTFVMFFCASAFAQDIVPKSWKELQIINDKCLVQYGHEFFKEGRHVFVPAPLFDDKVISVYFLKFKISACARLKEKVIYRCFEFNEFDGGMNIQCLIKTSDGKSVNTLAYNVKIEGSRGYDVKIDQELTDVNSRDWMCWVNCAIQCGVGIWNGYNQCGTDINCWVNQLPGLWGCVQQHCMSCF
jgi:hypothetical protein